jgi:hypothetical protein
VGVWQNRGMAFHIKSWRSGAVLHSSESAADLRAAILEALLSGANLSGANLRWADLSRADLSDAYLSGANLEPIRYDFWAVLAYAPKEIAGLRSALVQGRVDGCLVGTITNVRGCTYAELGILRPQAARPAERFFLGMAMGDTPETNQLSALAVDWIDDFVSRMREAFAG